MNIIIEGLYHCSGYCIGLKRILCSLMELSEKKVNIENVYFSLNNKYYCYSKNDNSFNYVFKNDMIPGIKYENLLSGVNTDKFLNSSKGNVPTFEQRVLANSFIKKYFHYNEDTISLIENEIAVYNSWKGNRSCAAVGYRGTDKGTECTIGSYDLSWLKMSNSERNVFFLMSDEEKFITETSKRFECYNLDIERKNGLIPIHKSGSLQKKDLVVNLIKEIEITATHDYFITNYSNIYDYISFLNLNMERVLI